MPLDTVPAAMTTEGLTATGVLATAAAANVKLAGDVVQQVISESSAVATGTTIIPYDDTIPQQTEGDQYLSVAITPTNSSNFLEIEVQMVLSHSVAGDFVLAAIFQDSASNALAAVAERSDTSGGKLISFKKRVVAGTTSATTIKARAGGNSAGTTTFNGNAGGRRFGGVMASFISVRELKA